MRDDPEVLAFFEEAWKDSANVAKKVLSETSFWGQDLTKLPGLAEKVQEYLNQFMEGNICKALP